MNTHQSAQCVSSLQPLLKNHLELVNAYNSYLAEVKQAITDNDVPQLNLLLTEQAPDISAIDQIAQQQQLLLKQFGYDDNEKGLDLCVQGCQQQVLIDLKTELDQQLATLEKSLLINDLLVKKNQQRVRQSIQILSGHQSGKQPSTYSSQGNTEDSSEKSRILAQV